MARLKDYLTTRTHEDYLWPHPIPLSEKPSQPPVRPGIRLYGPEPDDRICKENTNLDDYKHWSKRVEKAKDGDDEVLSDREKFMFLNKIDKKKKVNHELESLKSTYQVSYAANIASYDYVINEALDKTKDRKTPSRCKISKDFYDPTTFKKTIVEESIFV